MFIIDENAMLALGQSLTQSIKKGSVVFLHGQLGAGKTTLVRGFLQGLGFTQIVKSPTYTLVEHYDLNGCEIYHFDLYRLAHPEELEFIGFRDYLNPNSICFIEWPENAGSLLNSPDWVIQIDVASNGVGRQVEISPNI